MVVAKYDDDAQHNRRGGKNSDGCSKDGGDKWCMFRWAPEKGERKRKENEM